MSAPSSDSESAGLKALITCSVLGAAVVVAIVISKLASKCYDRSAAADDGSDISESMRNLMRARLSALQFRRKEIEKAQNKKTLSVFQRWIEKVRNKQQVREMALKSKRPIGDVEKVDTVEKVVITVEETDPEKLNENGRPKTARSPFFAGAEVVVSAQKPPIRPVLSTRMGSTVSDKTISPVRHGRPVSSKAHALPRQVTVTTVDEKNSPKAQPKLVHFNDETKKDGEKENIHFAEGKT